MKLADKQNWHEMWDEFENGPHCTIYFALGFWTEPIFDLLGMLYLRWAIVVGYLFLYTHEFFKMCLLFDLIWEIPGKTGEYIQAR